MSNYNKELWNKIMEIGKIKEPSQKGVANKFNDDDLNTIIASMDFFNASRTWLGQSVFDLKTAKYRLFDWLAMCLMGRNDDGESRKQNENALKVLVYVYLKAEGEPSKFIELLRYEDYDCEREWEKIVVEVEK